MNERIKKLFAKACWDEQMEADIKDFINVEKFAELIVRECAEVVQEGRWMVPPSQEQLANSVKKHFGVEE